MPLMPTWTHVHDVGADGHASLPTSTSLLGIYSMTCRPAYADVEAACGCGRRHHAMEFPHVHDHTQGGTSAGCWLHGEPMPMPVRPTALPDLCSETQPVSLMLRRLRWWS